MKRKIFALLLVLTFIVPCTFFMSGCGNKGKTWSGQLSYIDYDSVTNYWVEYSFSGTGSQGHGLDSVTKATDGNGVTYYYINYYLGGSSREILAKVNPNKAYEIYHWTGSEWEIGENERGSGSNWDEVKAITYTDNVADALGYLNWSGEVNSYWRHENGTEVKKLDNTSWTTAGLPYPNYTEEPLLVEPEEIANCLHFHDDEHDIDYYFAPDTHFLLQVTRGDGWNVYQATAKVYKRHFNMSEVLEFHDRTTAGLGFTLPTV